MANENPISLLVQNIGLNAPPEHIGANGGHKPNAEINNAESPAACKYLESRRSGQPIVIMAVLSVSTDRVADSVLKQPIPADAKSTR